MNTGRSALIFDWWLRQIKPAAPWLRIDGRKPADALIADIQGISFAPLLFSGNLLMRRDGIEKFVAALNPSLPLPKDVALQLKCGVRLPPQMLLHRTLVLPASAQYHLDAAIGYEMERLTPFAAREVVWGISGLKLHDRSIRFMILIVPRLVLEPLLAALHQMKLFPSFIDSGFGRMPLARHNVRPANPARHALLRIGCALTLLIVLIPPAEQQRRIDQLDRQLRMLRPERQETALLDRQLADFALDRAFADAVQANGDDLQTLAALTGALPDGTWLRRLAITPGEIDLAGQSDNAANLIAILTSSSIFQNPSFVGPITRANGDGEIFSIHASVVK